MRRALTQSWPALSYLYGLHPWDIAHLTMDEINAYLTDLARRTDG